MSGGRRGVALATGGTLGFAGTSDLGPTAGSGFEATWSDDLAALAGLAVCPLRITLDWSRLQPRPGALDGTWGEWYDDLLATAARLGLEPWLVLHEEAVPRWFDDAGGFADEAATAGAWPRWVERAADRYGDRAAGWIPLLGPAGHREIAWRDAWSVLRGPAPVVRAVALPDDRHLLTPTGPRGDRLGVTLEAGETATATAEGEEQRLGELLRMAGEADDHPLVVADLRPAGTERDGHGASVAGLRAATEGAGADGVPFDVSFVGPLVEQPGTWPGLLDGERRPTPSGDAWLR